MPCHILRNSVGEITFWDAQPFPGSTLADYDVVRGWDGKLYKAGEAPAPPSPTLEEQLTAIDTKYQQKFNELKESFTSAMIIDGAPMETNVALLRTKWAALIAAQQAEIDTVFSQE